MKHLLFLSCLLMDGCAGGTPPRIAATTNKSPEATTRASSFLSDPLTPAQEARKKVVRQQVVRASAAFEKAGKRVPVFPSLMVLPQEIELPSEIAEIMASNNKESRVFLADLAILGQLDNSEQMWLAELAFQLMVDATITVGDRPTAPGWVWVHRQRIRHTLVQFR